MNPRVFVGLSVVFLSCSSHLARSEHCEGPGDVNFDNHVGLGDFALLDSCTFGPTITEPTDHFVPDSFAIADLDGDGDVDLKDIAAFTLNFGADYFDYGPDRDDYNAEALAILISNELRAPDDLYNLIHGDLVRIITAIPEIDGIRIWIGWSLRSIIVRLDAGVPRSILDPLNHFFAGSSIRSIGGIPGLYVVTFCRTLNTELVAAMYRQLVGVTSAGPDVIGGDGDRILIDFLPEAKRYTLAKGSGDCLAGCICNRVWIVDVSTTKNEAIELLSYEEFGTCR